MPAPPLPPAMDEFLRRPNPCVIATVQPGGWPHTVPTWYDWEDGRVLMNLDVSRRRLRHLREDPRVALTVLDDDSWYRHLSLVGRVASIERDPDLRDIDRLATRYTGSPHRHRDQERWSVWIDVVSWHGWVDSDPWTR
jgi:PPOX class probable F420-dependent enzyme